MILSAQTAYVQRNVENLCCLKKSDKSKWALSDSGSAERGFKTRNAPLDDAERCNRRARFIQLNARANAKGIGSLRVFALGRRFVTAARSLAALIISRCETRIACMCIARTHNNCLCNLALSRVKSIKQWAKHISI